MPHRRPRVPVLTLPERFRTDLGRRAAGLLVALGLELLLILLLLSLGWSITPPKEPKLIEVDLAAYDYTEPPPEERAAEQRESLPAITVPQPELPPTLEPVTPQSPVIPVPRETPPPVVAPGPRPITAPPANGRNYGPPDSGSVTQGDSVLVGTAPDGGPLYGARWYREPTHSELRGYLSTATGPGWGLIACRTAPDYRVEDCVPLQEYPNGSMINRAILAAAWQFKVRPPRQGGKSLVGAWVRIRIDYTIRRE